MRQLSKKNLFTLKVAGIVIGAFVGLSLLVWWLTTLSYFDRHVIAASLFFGFIGWVLGWIYGQKHKYPENDD